MTLSITQTDKLIRKSQILMALTLLAMLATATLMTLRFSLLHPLMLVIQTCVLASQVICVIKLREIRERDV